MGAGQSIDESEAFGWRILKVMPKSPCADKGLVNYFILSISVTQLTPYTNGC
jgi:hypothetical protein